MRISDWSSDVCSSDLRHGARRPGVAPRRDDIETRELIDFLTLFVALRRDVGDGGDDVDRARVAARRGVEQRDIAGVQRHGDRRTRAEERRVGKEGVRKGRSRWSTYH